MFHTDFVFCMIAYNKYKIKKAELRHITMETKQNQNRF